MAELPIVDDNISVPSSPSQAGAASVSSSGTEELLSEADSDRLAEVFEGIDSWVGSADKMTTGVFINRSTDQTSVRRDVSKAFYSIMYDGDDETLPLGMDGKMAILSAVAKASDLYHRFKFIVRYLETPGQKNEPIRTFIQAIREDVTTKPHWQFPSTDSEEVLWLTRTSVRPLNRTVTRCHKKPSSHFKLRPEHNEI